MPPSINDAKGSTASRARRAVPHAGRATVELIIERKGDQEAFVTRSGGGPVPQARLGITLDGYSAPSQLATLQPTCRTASTMGSL